MAERHSASTDLSAPRAQVEPEGTWSFFLNHAMIFVFCLLAAHYVMIYELNLRPIQMNIIYMLIALPFGFDFFVFFRARVGAALLVGFLSGAVAVLGMSTVVWLVSGEPLFSDHQSKRDVAETALAIMLAYAAGNAFAATISQLVPAAFVAGNKNIVLTIRQIVLAIRLAFEGNAVERRINVAKTVIEALTALVLAFGALWVALKNIFTGG